MFPATHENSRRRRLAGEGPRCIQPSAAIPVVGLWLVYALSCANKPPEAHSTRARARSAAPVAACMRHRLRLLSLPPKQLRRPERLALRVSAPVAQPLSRYCTPVAAPGRKTARQGAQRNARRNMHQTQIALMLSPTQTAAAPRAPRAARFSDRFAPLWASIVLPSPSRRIEGAPGRAAQLLAAGTTSIMAILPGFSFGNRVR